MGSFAELYLYGRHWAKQPAAAATSLPPLRDPPGHAAKLPRRRDGVTAEQPSWRQPRPSTGPLVSQYEEEAYIEDVPEDGAQSGEAVLATSYKI